MTKEVAYQTVVNLLNAAVKSGLFATAENVLQVTDAVETLRPMPEISSNGIKNKISEHEKIN